MDARRDAYYASLCSGFPVRVGLLPGRGKALLLRAACSSGDTLFLETPLGSLQHASNKPLTRACDHCARFIGSLTDQFARLCAVAAPSPGSVGLPAEVVEAVTAGVAGRFPPLSAAWVPPAVDAEEATLSPVVPCAAGCPAEYCSLACRAQAARQYHTLLCVGARGEEGEEEESAGGEAAAEEGDESGMRGGAGAAAGAAAGDAGAAAGDDGASSDAASHDINAALLFEHMSLSTNEIFLLAGRLIARVLEAWVRNGNNLPAALEQLRVLHSEPWPQLFARTARPSGGAALAERVAHWLSDSLTILRSLLRERMPAFVEAVEAGAPARAAAGAPSRRSLSEAEWEELLSLDTYSLLVGAFELNNIEVKVASPLRDYLRALTATPALAREELPRLQPVLAQVAAAREARRQLREELRQCRKQGGAAGGAHAHGAGAAAHHHGGQGCDGEEESEEGEEESEEGEGSDGSDDGSEESDDYDSMEEEEEEEEEEREPCPTMEEEAGAAGGAAPQSARFPHVNGTALFALISQMNHSCVPNVQVAYVGGSHTAAVIAKQALAPGEELCINYVDVDLPLIERRDALRHYGFVCTCAKCESEAREEARGGSGGRED